MLSKNKNIFVFKTTSIKSPVLLEIPLKAVVMELKLARQELDAKPKVITFEKLLSQVKTEGEKIFYFDKTNSHKDIMETVKKFEEEGLSVYFKEIKYGLDEEDYMYQAHIL